MAVKSLDAFREGAPWPPEGEKERLDRYTQNRVLWKARDDRLKARLKTYEGALHDAAFFILNFHRRLSTLWADMLFSEPPIFTAGDEPDDRTLSRAERRAQRLQTDEYLYLQDLLEQTKATGVGYEVALDMSIYGDGLVRVGLEDGRAVIDAQPPRTWFPVVSPNNIRRTRAHVLAETITRGLQTYLLLEVHTRGRIEYKAFRLGNDRIGPPVLLSAVAPELSLRVGDAGVEQTGVDDFLIIPCHNLRTSEEVYGRDDYSDLDTLMAGLEERLDQINSILKKHADPMMYGPQTQMRQNPITGRWYLDTADKYVGMLDKDDPIPGYITWDGQLTDAMAFFNVLMEQLYFVSETSPAAFGQQKTGLAESGSALRRLMMPVLAKAGRMRIQMDPALKQALTLASELEGRTLESIGSQWRDGLPEDDVETATIVKMGRESGIMSRYEAVRRYHPDWTDEQIMDELEEIDRDEAIAAASNPAGAVSLFPAREDEDDD